MAKVAFTLEKRANESTGAIEDALIKTTTQPDGKTEEEQWLTVPELDRLFDTCSRRWSANGWDLEKLLTCINECEFD